MSNVGTNVLSREASDYRALTALECVFCWLPTRLSTATDDVRTLELVKVGDGDRRDEVRENISPINSRAVILRHRRSPSDFMALEVRPKYIIVICEFDIM